jgi:hypothetical protein
MDSKGSPLGPRVAMSVCRWGRELFFFGGRGEDQALLSDLHKL